MAFIQQQRRPSNRYPKYSTSDEEDEGMYLRLRYNNMDSDTDWHILSSCSTSPILFPSSEAERGNSSSNEEDNTQETCLPSHDGTGTFLLDEEESDHYNFIPTTAGLSSQQLVQISDNNVVVYNKDSVLSMFWKGFLRLGNHILENDTNTIERMCGVMTESVIEGCIPFGSHIHMEFDNHLSNTTFFDSTK